MTIILVCFALVTHYYLSISEYKHDKIAYVFDSALEGARNTSTMLGSDVEAAIEKFNLVLRSPLSGQYQLDPSSVRYISSERAIVAFYVVHFNKNTRAFEVSQKLENFPSTLSEDLILQIAEKALQNKMYIFRSKESANHWSFALPVAQKSGESIVVIGEFNRGSFLESFYSPQIQNFYLFDSQLNLVMEPVDPPYDISPQALQEVIAKAKELESASSFVKEFSTIDGEILVASAQVSVGGFRVLAIIPKSVALEALKVISIKSILLVMILIGLSIIISVIGANGLTKNLAKLYEGVKEITAGNLHTRVAIKSSDEVAVLADGFNMMTDKIQALLAETAEKARMENELQTAQTVQSTLFPKSEFKNQFIELYGFYEPASECGGDWYSYTILNNKAYLWIGDATGHGVSAALITSAAKSAASVIQTMPDIKTSEILSLMNIAVNACSGGNVLMTFVVACIDFTTGKMTFSNASHDTPYILRKKDEKYKRKDIVPLMSENGSRLGQELSSEYHETEVQLQFGDKLVFYTDGVTELADESQNQWGEGKFVRAIVKAFNSHNSVVEIGKDLLAQAYQFRGQEVLHDDVTYFVVEYKGANGVES